MTEALVAAAHPRADALLTVLAVDEPSALCRAVDRWSHDPRPERQVAAAVRALLVAPYAAGAGLDLLRHTARALLARDDQPGLHGAALALLVRDPLTRGRHLPAALRAFAADDPFVGAQVLGPALESDPEPVLAAVEARLARPGGGAAAVLRVLARAPAPAGRAGAPDGLPDPATRLVGRLLRGHPEWAELVAGYLDGRLALGRAARGDLTALLGARPGDRPAPVRRAFALVLAADGAADGAVARAVGEAPEEAVDPGVGEAPGLRRELLDRLLATEQDPAVLEPTLERVAAPGAATEPRRARAVVARIVDAWARAEAPPERLDALLVRCAGRSAAFAQLLAEWPPEDRPPVGGPLLAAMRALLARGRDPQYAAAEAERAPLRTAVVGPPRAGGVPVPGRGAAHGTL
ncbi:hypothetical protein GCM10009665_77640 [Kitasatospora nipponensis]|uniref:HEAT repeat protein n=1 Tax=Kitasatospora nipponensis TaxID=258049 RepID=A0ABN1T9A9_9ACTN